MRSLQAAEYGTISPRSLSPFKLEEYSDLVLGCTHFNYFKDTMASLLPVSTEIIDGSAGTVNHLVRILESRGLAGGGSGKVEYLVSGLRGRTWFRLCRAGRAHDVQSPGDEKNYKRDAVKNDVQYCTSFFRV